MRTDAARQGAAQALAPWRAGRVAARSAEAAAMRSDRNALLHYHVGTPSAALFARVAKWRAGGARVLVHAWDAAFQPAFDPGAAHWADRVSHRLGNSAALARRALLDAPDIMVSSQFQARQLRGLGIPGRLHVVLPGVDVRHFRPSTVRERAAARASLQTDGDPVILYYGSTSSWTGVATFVEALPMLLRQVPKAQALISIAGHGASNDRLRERLRQLGLGSRVTLFGPGDAPTLHCAADIAVVPAAGSVSIPEQAAKTLECMAAGLPVVASHAGMLPELVQDRTNGRLVAPGSASSLAQALVDLALDPAATRAMGAAARRHVTSHHAWPVVAGRVTQAYRDIMRQQHGAPRGGDAGRAAGGVADRAVPHAADGTPDGMVGVLPAAARTQAAAGRGRVRVGA